MFRQYSVCFGCFDTGPKHRNKLKKMFFGFAKQTEKQPKQIAFRFVSVLTKKTFDCFEDTLVPALKVAHLTPNPFHKFQNSANGMCKCTISGATKQQTVGNCGSDTIVIPAYLIYSSSKMSDPVATRKGGNTVSCYNDQKYEKMLITY